MACFLVPAAEALVTTLAEKGIEKKENDAKKELLFTVLQEGKEKNLLPTTHRRY